MLLQTNSYIVPKEKRAEHSRLIRRFRQTLLRLGCDHFEVYEQVGANWSNSESAGRYVQILRFLDRKHQLAVQAAERTDPTAQAVIADFCDLINFPYQQQQGLFAVGFYTSVLPVAPKRGARGELVSTVEHEVINDPEAEMPYPGASDGPPLNEAVEEPLTEAEPVPFEDTLPPLEPIESTPVEVAVHHEPLDAEVVEPEIHKPVEEPVVEPLTAHGVEPLPTTPADDFMNLVGGDLDGERSGIVDVDLENPFDEDSDDEGAHGFIEEDASDELNVEPHNGTVGGGVGGIVEPAHQHSKERPPGW